MSMLLQMLEQQRDFYKKMLQQQDNFKCFVQVIIEGTNKRLDDVIRDVLGVKSSLEFTQDKIDMVMTVQKEMETKVKLLETDITKSREELDMMLSKLDYIENQSRRNNLLVDGIAEERGENWDESERKVRDMLGSNMGLNGKDIEIERAHRVGQYQEGGRPRQIIVKLLRFKDKQAILSYARKLRGTNIYINKDFSEAV